MCSYTFDTTAMMALENRRAGISRVVHAAKDAGTRIIVPANVMAEWWRGGGRGQQRVLDLLGPALKIAEVTERIARIAGEALAWYKTQRKDRVTCLVTIDATVMATACLVGRDNATVPVTIYTGDTKDMPVLSRFRLFPGVSLLPPT
jgi:hypothetical protein